MAKGKGKKKWKRRMRRDRRPARPSSGPTDLPACSNRECPNRRPHSTHIIRKGDGTFFAACDACVEPMAQAVRLTGIDVQIVSKRALEHLGG